MQNEQQQKKHKAIMAYLSIKNQKVLDFNGLWEKENLVKFDFKNLEHLNTQGGLKLSSYLAEFLKNNYTFVQSDIAATHFTHNRYAIIDKYEVTPIIRATFDSLESNRYQGVEQFYFFEVYPGRYEIALEGSPENMNDVVMRYEYRFDPEEMHLIDSIQQITVHNNKIVAQRLVMRNDLFYKNKKYKIYQFNSVFSTFEDLKFFVINGTQRIELATIDKLILNDSNRQ